MGYLSGFDSHSILTEGTEGDLTHKGGEGHVATGAEAGVAPPAATVPEAGSQAQDFPKSLQGEQGPWKFQSLLVKWNRNLWSPKL